MFLLDDDDEACFGWDFELGKVSLPLPPPGGRQLEDVKWSEKVSERSIIVGSTLALHPYHMDPFVGEPSYNCFVALTSRFQSKSNVHNWTVATNILKSM